MKKHVVIFQPWSGKRLRVYGPFLTSKDARDHIARKILSSGAFEVVKLKYLSKSE
jgi:hypothetical protein